MALTRIGWENGTLVESAKLLEDNTIQPAQYEGSTPLNATNLKTMEDNVENFVNNELSNLKPVILYENESGTNGSVTLNDSVENYKFIELYGVQTNTSYTSGGRMYTKLYNPNGKKAYLTIQHYMNDRIYNFGRAWTFSGTAATASDGFGYVSGSSNYATSGTTVLLTHVIGYKYNFDE